MERCDGECQVRKGTKVTRIEGQGNGGNVIELTKETIDTIMAGQLPAASYQLIYKNGKSPLNVKIVDPLTVVKGTIRSSFQKDTLLNKVIPRISAPSVHWVSDKYADGEEGYFGRKHFG